MNTPRFIRAKFYYYVYDLGNGRVKKLETPFEFRAERIYEWQNAAGFTPSDLDDREKLEESFSKTLIESKKVLNTLPKEMFGNPAFINDREYEQDMASTRAELFQLDDERFMDFITEYVAFVKTLWRHGYGDTVYNFTVDDGISKSTRKFTCLDFSEFVRSKESISADIEQHKWSTQYSLRDFPADRSALKQKILALFDKEFTKEQFEELWQKNA